MATKTGLTNAISTAITVIITRTKLLLGLTELVNEVYPSVLVSTDSNTVVLTGETDFDYSFQIWKTGRTVHIVGDFQYQGFEALPSPVIALITNAEFVATARATPIIARASTGALIQLNITNNEIRIDGNSSPQRFFINATYPTLN